MADITAGLPTLRPEDIQAQQDRARLEALGSTIGAGAQRLGAAFNDIFTLPARGVMGAANTLLRVPNAFGANIPYIPDNGLLTSTTPYSDALTARGVPFAGTLPTMPAMTAPAPTKSTGSAEGTWVPAAAAPVSTPAPVQAATVPRTPKSGGTKTAGGMPAGAPAPLIPGETGFYMNDQLVPYGTRFLASGGGTVQQIGGAGGGVSMEGLPGGGKMVNGRFADPRDALEYGFRLQSQYRDDSMQRMLSMAGDGSQLGYRARVAALANSFGTNNFGSTSVGGANALNQAIAHITGAETAAGATMYSADKSAGASAAQTAERAAEFANTPRPIGQHIEMVNGLPTTVTTYGAQANAMPLTPINSTPQKAAPKEGATGKTPDGRAVVYRNGEWQLNK